jgi:hypothetical protein
LQCYYHIVIAAAAVNLTRVDIKRNAKHLLILNKRGKIFVQRGEKILPEICPKKREE